MLDSGESRATSRVVPHLFRVAVLVAFAILAVQLWRLQIVEGPQLRQRADNNRVRISPIQPPRGVIYDRNGTILASNAPSFVVSIIPADLKQPREAEVYGRLSALLSVPADEIREAVEKRKAEGFAFTPVPIESNVPRESALLVEQAIGELPGVVVSVESSRRYADGRVFAHLLGYTGPISPQILSPAEYKQKIEKEGYSINDRIGTAGLEDAYEAELRGRPGRRMYEVEASGRESSTLRVEEAEPGQNLVLTLDAELQRSVTELLSEGLKHSNVGVAVVSDARSGELLALVSLPSYDNNIFTDGARDEELTGLLKDPEQPFFNRAVAGNYPPGSTFKLVTALAALQERVATRDTVINSRGAIFVQHDYYPGVRQRFPDWPGAPQGRLNLIQAIANSTNVHFFYLGGGYEPEGFVGLGNERLARYARLLGFGSPTRIDLPGESSGTIPDEAWKLQKVGEKWVKGDTYNMAIGQGYVEATPLQIHNMTATLANGGRVLRPHVVRQVVDSDGNVVKHVHPEVIREPEVDPRYIRTLIEGMEAGFDGPLLREFKIPGLRVAGKTGTAEYGQAAAPDGELPTHGWFTGFAPVEDPQYVVTVFVDRGSSSRDAAPIAARILRQVFAAPDVPVSPGPAPSPPPNAAPATGSAAGTAAPGQAVPSPASGQTEP
ncbi:MAG: penicillin-binding protein 2, partial [Chloroflexota bacterium]|nr:penicillin-binding protein 2 [Chloroflexota bacterium]